MRGSRRGTSLVEIVVVMTVQTVILGLAVGLIGVVIASQRQGRQQLEQGLARDALFDQFRRDVHAARSAGDENQPVPELQLADDWRVTYQAAEEGIERLEFYGQDLAARELYRLPAGFQMQFEMEHLAGFDMLHLRVQPPTAANGRLPAAAWPCEAVLGRDHRYEE